jgi:excisionase family DNA binding protein
LTKRDFDVRICVEVINVIGKKYYTAKEIAYTLAVTPMTIYRMAERGELKTIRVGKSIRFDADDVENFLKSSLIDKNTKSTGRTLLEFVGKWAGDDADKIIKMIQESRSEAEF